MQRPLSVLLLFLLLAPAFGWAATDDAEGVHRIPGQPRSGALVGDRLIVRFEPGAVPRVQLTSQGSPITGDAALDALIARYGVHRLERLFPVLAPELEAKQPSVRALMYRIHFDGGRHALPEVADAFRELSGVREVQLVPIVAAPPPAVVPDDPGLSQQWWLRNRTLGNKDIRAIAGWYHETGSPEVVVAVVDTGVDWMHPDLGGVGPDYVDGNVWINWAEYHGHQGQDDDGNGQVDDIRGWDFVDVPPDRWDDTVQDPPQDIAHEDNDPMDYYGHGTPVAGLIAAITDNGIGVAGASWACKIMCLRISAELLDGGAYQEMDWIARAFDYARVNGARVINASLYSWEGGGLDVAVDMATQSGVLILCAAGNYDTEDIWDLPPYDDLYFLCRRSDVVQVAATTNIDLKAYFSNYGNWVDICAPGVALYTLAFDRSAAGALQHIYGEFAGTSGATPVASGVAAILVSAHPDYTHQQLFDALLQAVDEVDSVNDPMYEGKLGSGRVNMARIFDNPTWMVPEQLPSLLEGVNTAGPGEEVAVQGGITLIEKLQLPWWPVEILGGYDATYTTRDPVGNRTILQPPGGSTPVIVALDDVDEGVLLDGFHIRGGRAQVLSAEPVDGKYGGGVLIRGGSPRLTRCLIEGNVAGLSGEYGGGGAIAVLGGAPVFEDCEITGNNGLRGAAIYVHRGSPVFLNADIHDNVSYPAGYGTIPMGGAVYVVDTGAAKRALGDTLSFLGGSICGHAVQGVGGGIASENSNLVVRGVTLEDNTSNGHGGGIYLHGGSFTGSNNAFLGNTAAVGGNYSGGGLYAESAAVRIEGSRYEDNSASFSGGGLQLQSCPATSIHGSFLVENAAVLFGSGAYLSTCSGAVFSHNTVANNRGAAAGANGLYLSSGDAAISGSIFALNGGGGTSLADGVACNLTAATFSCNLVWANDAGDYGGCPDPTGSDGNAEGDPLFCNVLESRYDVSHDSPAAAANSGGCGDIGAGSVGCQPVGIVELPAQAVRAIHLEQNVPNPFNPRTRIRFLLPEEGWTTVRVYDLRGRVVCTLLQESRGEGEHVIEWDGRDDAGRSVASGTYFCELKTGVHRAVRKMVLVE